MAIIDNINRVLKERGMTGADLSRLIGVSSGVYSQWNTGTTKPSPKRITKIAEVLNVSVDYLLTGVEKETPAAPKNDGVAASEKARYVFENYDKMPPELKDIKAHILQTIKNYKPNCKPVERNRRPKLTW